jgi:hypothetical protein
MPCQLLLIARRSAADCGWHLLHLYTLIELRCVLLPSAAAAAASRCPPPLTAINMTQKLSKSCCAEKKDSTPSIPTAPAPKQPWPYCPAGAYPDPGNDATQVCAHGVQAVALNATVAGHSQVGGVTLRKERKDSHDHS